MRGEGPLRYPGAKSNLAPYLAEFLERHRLVGLTMIEPFAGSAAASRYLLKRDLISKAVLWEADPGAFAFWHTTLFHNAELCRRVEAANVCLREFDSCLNLLQNANSQNINGRLTELAYAFLFLNRTSYSGIVGAGPIGGRAQTSKYPLDCRFSKSQLISQLQKIERLQDKISIEFGDGISAIESARQDNFVYADPPYFSNGKKFYRKYFSTFDHYRLRKSLEKTSAAWLLSYDYDKKVEYLYRKLPVSVVNLYHCAREAGAKKEILVSPYGFARTSLVADEQSVCNVAEQA